MIEMICTPCGQPVEPNTSAIVGVEREGKLFWRWACEHNPCGDAAVILASSSCREEWLREHPEYIEDIGDLLTRSQHDHD
jgi:hypothetical protein